jgi:hypothetical protein
MTSTRSPSINTKARSATRRIELFHQRFGDGHFYLACHAALPIALTPDLLYSLWANFQQDTQGKTVEIPWIAVADLMLSNLCKEVGHELYEMDRAVRDELLNQLQQDSRFGLERIRELADFVMAYIERDLDHPDLDARAIAETQRWRAVAYLQPTETAREIATYFSHLNFKDKSEWIRMAALLETLSQPLSGFRSLLIYSQAMADFARGNLQKAIAQVKQIADTNNHVNVAGVSLPIPQAIQPALPENSARPEAQTNKPTDWLRWLGAAGLGTVVMALLFVGLQQKQNPTPQFSPDVASSPSSTPRSSSPTPSPRTSSSPRSSSPTPSPRASSSPPTPSPNPAPSLSPSPSVQQTLSPSVNQNSTSQPNPEVAVSPRPTAQVNSQSSMPTPQASSSPPNPSSRSVPSPSPAPATQPLPPSVELPVPYFSQRDNQYKPWQTSQPTSLAMVLYYYGVRSKTPGVQLEDELYQKYQEIGGDVNNWESTAKVTKAYGFEAVFRTDRTLEQIKQQLAGGRPVLAAVTTTNFGTTVCFIGYTPEGIIAHDPWGNPVTQYSNVDGNRVLFTNDFLNKFFIPEGSNSGWAMFITPMSPVAPQSSSDGFKRRSGGATR